MPHRLVLAALITETTTMKHTTHPDSKLLLAAVALGVLMISGSASMRADGERAKTAPGKTQHLASPGAIPEGLSAADWNDIRAA